MTVSERLVRTLASILVERRARERAEVEMTDRATAFAMQHRVAIAAETTRTLCALTAIADRHLMPFHVHQLTCLFRTAKTHLRRWLHAIHRYHTAVSSRLEANHAHDGDSCDERRPHVHAHLPSHLEIGESIVAVYDAWHVACDRVRNASVDPHSADAARTGRACHDLGEFIEAIGHRHGAITDEMEA